MGGCRKRACSNKCNCRENRKGCYRGPEIPCLNVEEGDIYDDIIGKIGAYICEKGGSDVRIDHISFYQSTGDPSNIPNQPGEIDTYIVWGDEEETIIVTELNVYNGADGTSATPPSTKYGNTLFVDEVYGNDATGTREEFESPFLTISAALTSANPGDTVIVRSGIYSEHVVLKDDVNIRFEEVELRGNMTDGGVKVRSSVSGGLIISNGFGKLFSLTGSGSDVELDITEIRGYDTAVHVVTVGPEYATLSARVSKITNQRYNSTLQVGGKGNVTLNVSDKVSVVSDISGNLGYSTIKITDNHEGRVVFKCPTVEIATSQSEGGGMFYSEESSTQLSKIDIEVDRVISNYDYAAQNTNGTIDKGGQSDCTIKIRKVFAKSRYGIVVQGDNPNGKFDFEGEVYCKEKAPLYYASNQVTTIRNSKLIRGNGGVDTSPTVIVGEWGTEPVILNPEYNGGKLVIKDTTIIKNKSSEETEGAIVVKQGIDPFSMHNVEIYSAGASVANSIKTSSGLDKDIYIRNVTSNKDLDSTSVTNISTGGVFYLDPNLQEYI